MKSTLNYSVMFLKKNKVHVHWRSREACENLSQVPWVGKASSEGSNR